MQLAHITGLTTVMRHPLHVLPPPILKQAILKRPHFPWNADLSIISPRGHHTDRARSIYQHPEKTEVKRSPLLSRVLEIFLNVRSIALQKRLSLRSAVYSTSFERSRTFPIFPSDRLKRVESVSPPMRVLPVDRSILARFSRTFKDPRGTIY